MSVQAPQQWWRCANCDRVLGEVVGCRLVIIVRGEVFNLPLIVGTIHTCRKCGYPNTITGVLHSEAEDPQDGRELSARRAAVSR